MKKLVFLMFAFIIASTSQAQIGKEFYNKYSDAKGVQTTYISPSMFKQMDQEALNIQCDNISLKSVHGMYVIDCDDPATIKRIKKDIDLKLSQNEFELMIESKDGDDCSRIYMAKKGNDTIGLVIFSEDSEDINIVFIDAASTKKSEK